MREVLQPLNEKAAEIVVKHADMLQSNRMEPLLLRLVAHVSAYRVILARCLLAPHGLHADPCTSGRLHMRTRPPSQHAGHQPRAQTVIRYVQQHEMRPRPLSECLLDGVESSCLLPIHAT